MCYDATAFVKKMKFFEAYQEVEEYHKFVYFRLLAFTGLRRGEAFALYETDVIGSEKAIDVNKTLAEDENGKNYVSHLSEHKKRSPLLKLDEFSAGGAISGATSSPEK